EAGRISDSALEEVEPKPRTEQFRSELTRLPELTLRRKVFRSAVRILARLLVFLFTKTEMMGMEYFPRKGPALVVANHLGDADSALGVALLPREVDGLAKIELYDFPVLGWLMDWYGVIWVHRGQADRKALREALRGFEEGRLVAIAPEGRESLTGSLEEGMNGAAYLALKGNVPVVPITLTGTGNKQVYGNMKRLKRTAVTLTVGPTFSLEHQEDFRESVREGTDRIMRTLANQLPVQYRGIYQGDRTDKE
ncbi:MAG: 1-acyl-sn-glycerol-3-phosphate acyltransferase, partial [Chloroflexi bacterium]